MPSCALHTPHFDHVGKCTSIATCDYSGSHNDYNSEPFTDARSSLTTLLSTRCASALVVGDDQSPSSRIYSRETRRVASRDINIRDG